MKSLLSVSVLVPAAAFAVAAAPANAAAGPSTELLYESYAAAEPVARTLPEPLTMTAGQAAEAATQEVDHVLRGTAVAPGLRAANPDPFAGAMPPAITGDAAQQQQQQPQQQQPQQPTGDLGSVSNLLTDLGLNQALTGRPVLREAQRAESPVSLLQTDVPAMLGAASPAGLPVGRTLFPPNARAAQPAPAGDLVGQADGVVTEAGGNLDAAGVGEVVHVLEASEHAAARGDGPVSLLDTPNLKLPAVPSLR
ncbi:hypothetical protein [Actinomadura sp. GC306]|uniref:hypothetical protein n=1 Tax=Actinomadura sp. GC306 TaxID=2530367 RepID=UPI0014052F65|nr:hypothetical protein [Actinomadura sp. GC306]